MSSKIEKLKEDIKAAIKTNGNQEITGQLLQDMLIEMIDTAYEKFEEPLFRVVTELPTENIELNTVYLVADNTSTDVTNKFIEYAYVDNAWEKLGEFKADVDLTDYAKKAEVNDVKQVVDRMYEKQYATDSVNIGDGVWVLSSASSSVAVGQESTLCVQSVAIGNDSDPSNYGVSIGYSTRNKKECGVSIGYDAELEGAYAIGIGKSAYVCGEGSIGIGRNANIQSGENSIAVGCDNIIEASNYEKYDNKPRIAIGNNNHIHTAGIIIGNSVKDYGAYEDITPVVFVGSMLDSFEDDHTGKLVIGSTHTKIDDTHINTISVGFNMACTSGINFGNNMACTSGINFGNNIANTGDNIIVGTAISIKEGSNAENNICIGEYTELSGAGAVVLVPNQTVDNIYGDPITTPTGNGSVIIGADNLNDTTNLKSLDCSVIIGNYNNSCTQGDIAIGLGNTITSSIATASSIAIGSSNTANGSAAIALGSGNKANGGSNVFGSGNTASGSSLVLGISCNASSNGVALGINCTSSNSVVLGASCTVKGAFSIAIGRGATITGENNISVGTTMTPINSHHCVSIGINAVPSGNYAAAIGTNTIASVSAVAISNSAHAYGECSVAIGFSATATGNSGIALGSSASTVKNGVALGSTASSSTYEASIAIGYNATCAATSNASIVIGKNKQFATSCFSVGDVTSSDAKNLMDIKTSNKGLYIQGLGKYDGTNLDAEGVKSLQEVISAKADILEQLDSITAATTADEVITKFNALLADLKAKGYMKS